MRLAVLASTGSFGARARLATAAALLLAFGGALALAAHGWRWAWGALIITALAAGMFEWARLLGLGRVWSVVYAALFPLNFAVVGLEMALDLGWTEILESSMGFLFLLLPSFWAAWLFMVLLGSALCSEDVDARRASRFVWGWGGLSLTPLAAGVMLWMPWSLVLFLLLVVAATDAAAFWAGRRFGRRLLAPRISPGKTWVGLGAGLAGAGLVGALLPLSLLAADTPRVLWDRVGPEGGLLLGLVVGACVVAGDLTVSVLKRSAGVKDSGRLLPGHGGALDRIDGFLLAAPAFAFVAMSWLWDWK